jgi:hypothetical protein
VIPPFQIWHVDTHRSPRTFAKEVRISARMTSEKKTGLFSGGRKIRLIALQDMSKAYRCVQEDLSSVARVQLTFSDPLAPARPLLATAQ